MNFFPALFVLVFFLSGCGRPCKEVREAQMLLKAGRPEEAVPVLRQALKRRYGDDQVHAVLGDAYMALNALEQASDAYLQALELNPVDASLYNALGRVYWKKGALTPAVQMFNTAIKKDPRFIAAYENLGDLFILVKNFEGAEEVLAQAAELDPGNLILASKLAHVRAELPLKKEMPAA